jgi:hypothetical protein
MAVEELFENCLPCQSHHAESKSLGGEYTGKFPEWELFVLRQSGNIVNLRDTGILSSGGTTPAEMFLHRGQKRGGSSISYASVW